MRSSEMNLCRSETHLTSLDEHLCTFLTYLYRFSGFYTEARPGGTIRERAFSRWEHLSPLLEHLHASLTSYGTFVSSIVPLSYRES